MPLKNLNFNNLTTKTTTQIIERHFTLNPLASRIKIETKIKQITDIIILFRNDFVMICRTELGFEINQN